MKRSVSEFLILIIIVIVLFVLYKIFYNLLSEVFKTVLLIVLLIILLLICIFVISWIKREIKFFKSHNRNFNVKDFKSTIILSFIFSIILLGLGILSLIYNNLKTGIVLMVAGILAMIITSYTKIQLSKSF